MTIARSQVRQKPGRNIQIILQQVSFGQPQLGKNIFVKLVRFTGPPSTVSVVFWTSRGISSPAGFRDDAIFSGASELTVAVGAAVRGAAADLRARVAVYACALT